MQRMPPLLGFATPHPSPETNHCRARACTSPPPPSRAARSHAAPAAARRLLKGGSRPLKAPRPHLTAERGDPVPGKGPPSQAEPAPRRSRVLPPPSPPGAAFLFRRRLRKPGRTRCIVGVPESRFRRRRRAQSEPVSAWLGEGGGEPSGLKGNIRPQAHGGRANPLRAARARREQCAFGAHQRCLERGRARAWWGRFKKEAPPAPLPPRGAGEGRREGERASERARAGEEWRGRRRRRRRG